MQNISDFIERWNASGSFERANCALFLTEQTEILNLKKSRRKWAPEQMTITA